MHFTLREIIWWWYIELCPEIVLTSLDMLLMLLMRNAKVYLQAINKVLEKNSSRYLNHQANALRIVGSFAMRHLRMQHNYISR